MRCPLAGAILALLAGLSVAQSNTTTQSRLVLPDTFVPPAVFENVNLVRMINLERIYARESINVVIKNVGKEPADQYYIPFEGTSISRIGGMDVRDKQNAESPPFVAEVVGFDSASTSQYYRITLPQPLPPNEQITLAINYYIINAQAPLPAKIGQEDKQYLQLNFSIYFPSAYPTQKQKTKLRFPSETVPNYTELPLSTSKNAGITSENVKDPVKSGTTFTYGPFSAVPAGVLEAAQVRYEYTHPLTHVDSLERDVEVSHWGGNIAVEERYELVNRAAGLTGQFSRVTWQQAAYYNPPSVALKNLWIPLLPGSKDAYFIDDIGNVSTSKFQLGDGKTSAAVLDIKPRYPVFGNWRYKFKIGWDRDLAGALRRLKDGQTHVLKVPFIEGPKERQGIEYDRVVVRVILPEGAMYVENPSLTDNLSIQSHSISVPVQSVESNVHKTFLDTLGRTTLVITAANVVDEARNADLYVTYTYTTAAMIRKPLIIFVSLLGVFITAWAVARVEVKIDGRKR